MEFQLKFRWNFFITFICINSCLPSQCISAPLYQQSTMENIAPTNTATRVNTNMMIQVSHGQTWFSLACSFASLVLFFVLKSYLVAFIMKFNTIDVTRANLLLAWICHISQWIVSFVGFINKILTNINWVIKTSKMCWESLMWKI